MRDLAVMPQRLEAFLSHATGRSASVTAYRPLAGGYSRVMAAADISWDDGRKETLVLRGDPPPGEAPFESDRDLEWAFMRNLQDLDFPVPEPRWYDATGEHLGTKCIVMGYCDYPTLHSRHAEGSNPLESASLLARIAARIHAISPADLTITMQAPTDWDAYLDGLIAGVRDVDATMMESFPSLHFLASWFQAHRPPPVPLTLVHGDFNAGNILVGLDGSHMVLDWEMAHVGDPREDLGYYVNAARMMGYSSYDPDPSSFLAKYREATGLTEQQVNEATVGYFALLAPFKVMVPVLATVAAMARGEAHGSRLVYLLLGCSEVFASHLDTCAALSAPLAALRDESGVLA